MFALFTCLAHFLLSLIKYLRIYTTSVYAFGFIFSQPGNEKQLLIDLFATVFLRDEFRFNRLNPSGVIKNGFQRTWLAFRSTSSIPWMNGRRRVWSLDRVQYVYYTNTQLQREAKWQMKCQNTHTAAHNQKVEQRMPPFLYHNSYRIYYRFSNTQNCMGFFFLMWIM